ncbi:hypothetical protein [Streptomyces achromogenes]|uniref:hypothetical protein n=1 Tax=Streptomyces achromogenes TaxID=67255 RepID=UPI0004CA737D|nr:hypothetical protein [Streptomyces achromogenes]
MQHLWCTGLLVFVVFGGRGGRIACGAVNDLLHRPLQGTQELPLGFFHPGLDVPLPDVVDQTLDRLVEPLPQQPGAEGFDLTAVCASMPSRMRSSR